MHHPTQRPRHRPTATPTQVPGRAPCGVALCAARLALAAARAAGLSRTQERWRSQQLPMQHAHPLSWPASSELAPRPARGRSDRLDSASVRLIRTHLSERPRRQTPSWRNPRANTALRLVVASTPTRDSAPEDCREDVGARAAGDERSRLPSSREAQRGCVSPLCTAQQPGRRPVSAPRRRQARATPPQPPRNEARRNGPQTRRREAAKREDVASAALLAGSSDCEGIRSHRPSNSQSVAPPERYRPLSHAQGGTPGFGALSRVGIGGERGRVDEQCRLRCVEGCSY